MPGSVLKQCLAQHCEYFWISLSLLLSPKLGLLLLLLVCVSFTIIGQPRNSVLIRRV